MKQKPTSCCGKPAEEGDPATEIPEQIQTELDAMGGLEALASRIPSQEERDKRSRIYQALSDPLRLSLYHQRPAALCLRHQPVHASFRFKTLLSSEYTQRERPD